MTRRALLALVLALASALAAAGPARAGIQDFYFVNNGKYPVAALYVSPSNSESWENNVLGGDLVAPNKEVQIQVQGFGAKCAFDIRIVDQKGTVREHYGVDLCSVTYVKFP